MASGEYASVSTQKDTEKAAVAKEEQLLKNDYEGELAAVKEYYVNKGVTPETSIKIAKDLLNKKPLRQSFGLSMILSLVTILTLGMRHFLLFFQQLLED